MKKLLLACTILAFSQIIINGQQVIYGPEAEPPGGLFTESNGTPGDNLIGKPSGKEFTFSAIPLLSKTDVFYGTLVDGVKLSLDGADFASNPDSVVKEVLQFDLALSDLAGGLLVFKGSTEISDKPGVPVYTRFAMRFYDAAGGPLVLASAESLGLDPYLGGIPVIGAGESFKVNLQFSASYTEGGTYTPHIDFYDVESLTDGEAYSSFSWGWYWYNSKPELVTNDGFNVNEGDTVRLVKLYLDVEDVESDSSQLYFELVSETLPANGTLFRDDQPLGAGDLFTLADVENDSLFYVHNGSETTQDSMAVRLYDHDGAYYHMDSDTTLYIPFTVTPVDDLPEVVTNATQMLDEGTEVTLSATYLETTDSESSSDLITYTMDPNQDNEWPKAGILKKSGVPVSAGGTFTQKDIEDGLITYTQDGSETALDGFIFSVTDQYLQPAVNTDESNLFFFELSVTFTNDNPIFSKNVSSNMTEWEMLTIDENSIAASDEESPDDQITFTLVPDLTLPQFGHLEVDGTEIGPGGTFTMQDLLDDKVVFVQVRNATTETDKFVFQITDGDGGMAADGEFTDFQHIINITLTSVENNRSERIQLYPNPGNGHFLISASDVPVVSVQAFDLQGRVVYTEEAYAPSTVDLTGQRSGIYLVEMGLENGSVVRKRVVIE